MLSFLNTKVGTSWSGEKTPGSRRSSDETSGEQDVELVGTKQSRTVPILGLRYSPSKDARVDGSIGSSALVFLGGRAETA
jgi:hypothetical protein